MSKIFAMYGWGFGFVAVAFCILTTWSFAYSDVTFGLLMGSAMFFFELVSMVMFIQSDKLTRSETKEKVR